MMKIVFALTVWSDRSNWIMIVEKKLMAIVGEKNTFYIQAKQRPSAYYVERVGL